MINFQESTQFYWSVLKVRVGSLGQIVFSFLADLTTWWWIMVSVSLSLHWTTSTTHWFMRTINFNWTTIESINKQNNRNQFFPPQETNTHTHTSDDIRQRVRVLRIEEKNNNNNNKIINSMMKALLRCYMPHFNSWHMQPSIILKLDSGELTFNRSYWNTQTHTLTCAHGSAASEWLFFLFDERAKERLASDRWRRQRRPSHVAGFFPALLLLLALMQSNVPLFLYLKRCRVKKTNAATLAVSIFHCTFNTVFTWI